MAPAVSERGLIGWPGAIVLVGMMTSACAAPELRALAAGGAGMVGSATQPVVPKEQPVVPKEEPRVLAELELDSITASGVLVNVGSIAAAVGRQAGLALTNANTVVLERKLYEIGVGFTKGEAFACCGEEADVAVGSAVYGVGDVVHGTVQQIEHDGPLFAYGFSVGFVLAVSFRRHWATNLEQRHAIVEELQATSADLNTQFRAATLDLNVPDVR